MGGPIAASIMEHYNVYIPIERMLFVYFPKESKQYVARPKTFPIKAQFDIAQSL